MHNKPKLDIDSLPSTASLLKSTFIAAVAALAILITMILPAEYGIDPTGVGRLTGLTEMGEIKLRLAEEAKLDREQDHDDDHHNDDQSTLSDHLLNVIVSTSHAQALSDKWTDEQTFTMMPAEGNG